LLLGLVAIVAAGAAGFAGGELAHQDTPSVTPSPQPTRYVSVVRATLSNATSVAGTLGYQAAPLPIVNQLQGTVTSEAAIGTELTNGSEVYAVDDQPVYLLIGNVPLWRPIVPGSDGPDVAEVKAALNQLIPGSPLSAGATLSWSDAEALAAWQDANGYGATPYSIPFGEFVVEPQATHVESLSTSVGETIAPGSQPVAVSTTQEVVTAAWPQDLAVPTVGTKVSVEIGAVSAPGTIAQVSPTPASGGAGGTQSGATADTATVTFTGGPSPYPEGGTAQVVVTTAEVHDVLAVPIAALLALSEGGYGLQVVGAGGHTHLIAVKVGLVDDTQGLAQVTAPGLTVGTRVVAPAS
jgi:hypothetical protein